MGGVASVETVEVTFVMLKFLLLQSYCFSRTPLYTIGANGANVFSKIREKNKLRPARRGLAEKASAPINNALDNVTLMVYSELFGDVERRWCRK